MPETMRRKAALCRRLTGIPTAGGHGNGDPVLIDFALQGGGAHGAFTRGALDRLLDEPRRLFGEGSFSSIARVKTGPFGLPKTRALSEATVFAGLRKAGVPEE
jgi:hypothetical protein